MTTINVTAGAQEYVGGTITELTGKDISADTFDIGLAPIIGGTSTPPTVWGAPTVSAQGGTPASRVLLLLVTNTTTPGWYSCWCRVHDSPEVAPRLLQDQITVQ